MMLKKLFEKRLLRKIPKDLDKSKKSLEISKMQQGPCYIKMEYKKRVIMQFLFI